MPDPHPLLELQRIDSADDALCKEREALPQRAALADNHATLSGLQAESGAARTGLAGIAQEERRIEGEVEAMRAHAKEVETTLYSGTVTAVSELEGLQTQLNSLREQQGALEEQEMALLERQEALEGELAQLEQQNAEIERQNLSLIKALETGEARIDGLRASVAAERERHLPSVPAPALGAYQKLRGAERLGGLAVAPLEKAFCGVCRSSLPVTHVGRIRGAKPDDVNHCQNCQRLIVAPTAP